PVGGAAARTDRPGLAAAVRPARRGARRVHRARRGPRGAPRARVRPGGRRQGRHARRPRRVEPPPVPAGPQGHRPRVRPRPPPAHHQPLSRARRLTPPPRASPDPSPYPGKAVMSAHTAPEPAPTGGTGPPRVPAHAPAGATSRGGRITMRTAYDAVTARIFDDAGMAPLRVGDSIGNTMHGHAPTLPVTVDELMPAARAVARGA